MIPASHLSGAINRCPPLLRLQTHRGDSVPVGLYKDTACTTKATTAGDAIAAWRDETSGSGLVATQSASGSRPTLQFVSGKPVVRFDGVDDCLQFAAVPPFALAAGGEVIASATVGTIGGKDSGDELWLFTRDTNTGRSFAFGVGQYPVQIDGSDPSITGVSPSGRTWLGFRGNSSLGWIMSVNGSDVGTGSWVAPASTATPPSIGCRGYPGFQGFWTGDMTGLCAFPAVVAAADRASIGSYLSAL